MIQILAQGVFIAVVVSSAVSLAHLEYTDRRTRRNDPKLGGGQ